MKMMNRLHNWDTWLVEFAIKMIGQPFKWGQTDCATLVRNGLRSIYGRDVWRGHVGIWTARRGALIVSNRTKPKMALRASGAVETHTKHAWSGDVALGPSMDAHGMFQLSLLIPNRKALTSTPETGVIVVDTLSLTKGTRFWHYVG